MTRMRFHRAGWVPLIGFLLVVGCKSPDAKSAADSAPPNEYRDDGQESSDSEVVAKWLLAELVVPGGDAEQALRARKRLDDLDGHGLLADLARGLDDELHGRLAHAPEHYLKAAQAGRLTAAEDSDLLVHFAVHSALRLRSNTQKLFQRWQPWVSAAIEDPKHLGFRARDELVQWAIQEAWADAAGDVDARAVKQLGCIEDVRIAGPFGAGAASDSLRSYEPEFVAVWPERFSADPVFLRTPRTLKTDRNGCTVEVDEPVGDGVFYGEAMVEASKDLDAILLVKGAVRIWVDGVLVFQRDLREWGSWTRVAAGIRLPKGRHRLVARLSVPHTSFRLMQPNGLPLALTQPESDGALLTSTPGQRTFEPSALRRFVGPHGVSDPATPWVRYAAAGLAHADGEDEAAALLIEPLVANHKIATGPSLAAAAGFAEGDPLFDASQTEDLMRELHRQALNRDPNLWASELHTIAQVARSRGVSEAVPAFEQLTQRYQEVPPLLGALANVYGELGWTPEYARIVKLRAERFPEDPEGLYVAAQVYADEGDRKTSDALYDRIRRLDPDSEVFVGLSLERKDYAGAIKELNRLKSRRPKRKDIAQTIEEVKVRAGDTKEMIPLLEGRVEESPFDASARLALADARFAAGDANALRNAIVDSAQAGANPEPTKQALDLVEGLTELEAYRLDAKQIISDYEKAAVHLPGTAARVLDYMATWVRSDGSSRMLEHEIIRIQSEEAIGRFAEHEVRGDVVLQMRVIKKDGRILEPEPVAGKPTVTFPHLEVGDYIETEQIFAERGSPEGAFFDGPHWFFQEQAVAYARSEFVVITPRHKSLEIESTGAVPTPTVERKGEFQVHHWRVDFSPPAVDEPMSAPPAEYLPSVRISWGLDLARRLRLLNSQVMHTTPVDPRIVRIAKNIVDPIPASQPDERAQRLYHWVLDNVQQGEEDDGRRAVTGKRGNPWRAFEALCRALDIEVKWAIARNRLAPPPRGRDMLARQYSTTLLRVGGTNPTWLTFDGKFVPYGYVPAALRGMSAYLLEPDVAVPITIPTAGTQDGVTFDIDAKLSPNGDATLRLTQIYAGQYASALRQAFDELPEARLHDVLEERLLATAFPGARLLEYELQKLDDVDDALSIVMEAEMAHFARSDGNHLIFAPPYATRLSQLAALPTRHTPMLLPTERRQHVTMRVQLPAGARATAQPQRDISFGDFAVSVDDQIDGANLTLDRSVLIPATRIAPEDYAKFQRFTREADAVITRDVLVDL